ncbi:hypothetical protein ACLOJK_022715 [Asimina triloba]
MASPKPVAHPSRSDGHQGITAARQNPSDPVFQPIISHRLIKAINEPSDQSRSSAQRPWRPAPSSLVADPAAVADHSTIRSNTSCVSRSLTDHLAGSHHPQLQQQSGRPSNPR